MLYFYKYYNLISKSNIKYIYLLFMYYIKYNIICAGDIFIAKNVSYKMIHNKTI